MSFEFNELDDLDWRAEFANDIFKLIYQKHNGDLEKSLKDAQPFISNLEEHVRNIYECIDTDIPLWALSDLKEHGADDWDFTEEEYQQAIKNAEEACVKYYS